MFQEICAKMVCTSKVYYDDQLDDESILSIVHKIPEFIEFETASIDTEKETNSTYYEEICIDRLNILEQSLLAVNEQVNVINEKLEKEEEEKQQEEHITKINEPGEKENDHPNQSKENNPTTSSKTIVKNEDNGIDTDEVRSTTEESMNQINSQERLVYCKLEPDETNMLSTIIEEQLEIHDLVITVEEQLKIIEENMKRNYFVEATKRKKKIRLKDIVQKVIVENRKKKKLTTKNTFATMVWEKIIEQRQEFVDENAIDYNRVRSMWRNGSVPKPLVSSNSIRSLTSNVNERHGDNIASSRRDGMIKKRSVKDLALKFSNE